jgi:tyrosyl-tRNA synthetase
MKKTSTAKEVIFDILNRGTVNVITHEGLEKKLRSGKPLRIKLGIDPSGPDLHLGHAVVLRKLKQFQDAGHQVVVIIGDWTARIGDPTGKNEMRPQLTPAQVKKNADKYLKQLFLVLDKKKTEVQWQSKWFNKFNLQDAISLMGKFTVAQLLDRDDFRKRMKEGLEIGYHEPLYSLLQGYDSVAVKADVELGATEQLFNILKGRDMQALYNQPAQAVMTMEILPGLDGVQKMGKSLNNYIALLDTAENMFGKVMSIPDDVIITYFRLATDVTEKEILEIDKKLKQKKENPRNLKVRLAKEIVTLYHGAKPAEKAKQNFDEVFKHKSVPTDIPTIKIKKGSNIIDALIQSKLATGTSDARRTIEQGGVKIDGEVVTDTKATLPNKKEVVLQRGKRQFCKLIIK